MKEGYSLLHPLVSFCSIIPDNSFVFEVVKTGDVNGLVELFNMGAAAPTDCDTKGRPLLIVSIDISVLRLLTRED